MKRPSNNTSLSNFTPPTSPRDLTPPTSPRHVQQTNTQTTQSITEQPSTTPPQLFQRTPVDRNILFPSGSTNNPNLQPLDPFFNHGFIPTMTMNGSNIPPSGITNIPYPQFIDPVFNNGFMQTMPVNATNNISPSEFTNNLFPQFINPFFNHGFIPLLPMYDPNKSQSGLTDHLYTQLVDPLSRRDFETAMRIAGVNSIEKFYDLVDYRKKTLLMFAAKLGHTEVIKALLSKSSNPDSYACMKDRNGLTALLHAAKGHNPESVKALLANVKNQEKLIYMKDQNDWTALMYAANFYDYVSIKNLLEGVSDPEQLVFMKKKDNETAMTLAIEKEQYRYVSFSDESEDCDEQKLERLHQAKTIRVESIKALLSVVKDKDAFICEQDANGQTMLSHTLYLNSPELIKFLLDSVNNPEKLVTTKDSKGKNLLMHAASSGKAKSIEVILSVVKNPEAYAMIRDSEGLTALMHAIVECHPTSLKAILSNVNNPDQLAFMKDNDDLNALMQVVIYGTYYTMTALLDCVKNPAELIYSSMHDGTTALMLILKNIIVDNFDSDVITVMLEKSKKERDPNQRMSLTYSKGKNTYISLPPDSLIFLTDSKGMNAFMIAIERNHIEATLAVFNSTIDKLGLFTAKNNNQRTAIDLFHAEYGNEMCDALIERVEHLQLSDHSEDLVTVMRLLQQRRNRFH